jgi:pSer/pThr/pTyr-binding forkhead associated (FHA) protein
VAKLVIQQKGKPPRSYSLETHTTILGRGRDCGLILPDISVSRHHAQVVQEKEGPIIHDLGSQNGTSVNASRISNHKLENGDVIQIGKFVLVFRSTTPKEAALVRRDNLDDYEVSGRTGFLEKVTALSGVNAHQTANISRQDLQSIRESLTRKEKGSIRCDSLNNQRIVIGEKARQFGKAIPCEGLRGGIVVVVWSGRTHQVIKKSGLFTTLKVNGTTLKEKSLEPGDVIELGKNRFCYET